MGLLERNNPYPDEPWKCDGCGELMYNRTAEGYPASGGPIPHFISTEFSRVCSVCKALWDTVGNRDYWRTVQREAEQTREKRKKKIDGLSGKNDYFTGEPT